MGAISQGMTTDKVPELQPWMKVPVCGAKKGCLPCKASGGDALTLKGTAWRFVPRLQASSGDGADTQAGTVVGATSSERKKTSLRISAVEPVRIP